MKLVIKGGMVVTAAGVCRADIGVEGESIVALAPDLPAEPSEVIHADGCWVYPGGVDVHCHLPWPSTDVLSGDDVTSGTRAAVAGGTTTVLDFVIPNLGESLADALERKLAETERGLYADYGAHICVREVNGRNLSDIPALVQNGFPSFKIFLAYEGFRLDDQDVLRLMDAVRKAGGVVSVHAENGLLADRATRALVSAGQTGLEHYPDSRPAYCEHEAIARIIRYAAAVDVQLHVHHVSTAEGAAAIGSARDRGLRVTGETCPQYLLFHDELYRTMGQRASHWVIAPPLRGSADQAALWVALSHGVLTMVATDHCPYSLAQKAVGASDFTRAPGGLGGVETRWPLLFTEGVRTGRLTPERLAAVWAANPARAFGLSPRKGSIAVGSDADLIIVDPARTSQLTAAGLHSNTDCCVYEGRQVVGFPVTTLLRGKVVARDGEPVGEPQGRVIRRKLAAADTR